jgi:tRNA1(Val) A37 N6-methylase TrmN6
MRRSKALCSRRGACWLLISASTLTLGGRAQAATRPNLPGAGRTGKVASLKGQPDTTTDTLLGGKLRLLQPRSGYRINIDSVLLVGFAGERRVERVVDLGAGVGALGLLALARGIAKRALLLEADAALVELARRNLTNAGFSGEARQHDVTSSKLHETGVPLVLCNPPYYPAHSHRPAQSAAKAAARSGDVTPFLRAAAGIVSRKTGRALFSYPASQLPELLARAAAVELVAKRLRTARGARDRAAARRVARLTPFAGAAAAQRRPSKRSKMMAAAARTLR